MTLRITRRLFRALPDNPVCFYYHPHPYLSTCPTQFLDAVRRQALLSGLESEYSSAQPEFHERALVDNHIHFLGRHHNSPPVHPMRPLSQLSFDT